MSTIIPIRSSTLPPGELAAVLEELPAALPEAEARVVEGKSGTMLDPATLALFVGAAATTVAGLITAIATIWAARIAAQKPAGRAASQLIVIVVETNHTAVRVAVDPADPAGSVAAAPLPAFLSEVTGVRLER
jgi:hypothetical protein